MKIITQDGMKIYLENCGYDEIIVQESVFAIFGVRNKISAISCPENIRQYEPQVLGKYHSLEYANSLCREINDKWKNGEKVFEMPIEQE
jgi:hypothetical protein